MSTLYECLSVGRSADTKAIQTAFRMAAAPHHPDRHVGATGAVRKKHEAAFKAISEAYAVLGDETKRSLYDRFGDSWASHVTSGPLVVLVKGKPFTVLDKIFHGDLSDVHDVAYEDGSDAQHDLVKIASNSADNDLLENEAAVLRHLDKAAKPGTNFGPYYAKLIESFVVNDTGRAARRANVVQRAVDFVSLADVLKAHPNGIDFRDAAWMLKRWMVGLGYAHHVGIVHGAVVPTHLLLMPDEGTTKRSHAGKIIDWAYSVNTQTAPGHIKALVPKYKDLYAPEVFRKMSATPSTDIYMLGRCALALIERNAPKSVIEFWEACVRRSPSQQDLWRLHEEYEALLRRLCGPPTYRLFHHTTS